jgi:hypothetical protein
MALPCVADEEDGLQIWRVAANILNPQSRTADKGWSSSFSVWRGADILTVKEPHVTICYTGIRTWIRAKENGHEIWNMEFYKSLQRTFTQNSSK